ncbi:MAG: hypothetical protein V8R12_15170 [Bacteroides faecis]
MTFNWQMFYGGKAPFEGMEQLNILEANPFDGGTFDLANGILSFRMQNMPNTVQPTNID